MEITNYVNIISKQIFHSSYTQPIASTGTGGKLPDGALVTGQGPHTDFQMIGECLAVARRHCSALTKNGLDMLFLLDDLFTPPLSDAIVAHIASMEGTLKTAIDEDDFMDSNQPGKISLLLLLTI